MKKEYDFSKGTRGRFFRKDAVFNIPIYLDDDNRQLLEKFAQRKNSTISTVVNDLIRSERESLKAVEQQ